MRGLRLAMGCLTVFPVGDKPDASERDFRASLLWFPILGIFIGAFLLGWRWVLMLIGLAEPLAVAGGIVVGWVVVTGALHLDGLGDVADGIYGGRTQEERLRIMKDPHVGAMAVVTIVCVLLMKFCFISSLTPSAIDESLLLATCLGRYAMVVLATTLPYARTKGGTAQPFIRTGDRWVLWGATGLTAFLAFSIHATMGLIILVVAWIGTWILRGVFARTLGGITGDALGATVEITEVIVLLAMVRR